MSSQLEFTKEIEEQVIGRAQRLGRQNALNIHYLVHDNEENSFDNLDECNNVTYEDVRDTYEHFRARCVGDKNTTEIDNNPAYILNNTNKVPIWTFFGINFRRDVV